MLAQLLLQLVYGIPPMVVVLKSVTVLGRLPNPSNHHTAWTIHPRSDLPEYPPKLEDNPPDEPCSAHPEHDRHTVCLSFNPNVRIVRRASSMRLPSEIMKTKLIFGRIRLLQSTSEKLKFIYITEAPYQCISGRRLHNKCSVSGVAFNALCNHHVFSEHLDHQYLLAIILLRDLAHQGRPHDSAHLINQHYTVQVDIKYGLCSDDVQSGCQVV
ncbi:hypothetical protein E2P81_ATG02618 [Venturia nashicola]|uniref:Uncharacterized protein n=1 Tax=Venturia nashicola TaxID=86259 RepID=A0A4Z1P5U4_9PEZI|nr:hypothetical protein E6O75_ATG02682 [Venturia nashicola]TLD36836.1 hypothetical protein E2P81_ATG02618 [Venturia nashicola]